MAVSRHLDFIESEIAPFDPPFPKTYSLEPNMEWIGCAVCEIFAFKLYTVTLKLGFWVTEGHRKLHH